MFNVEAKVVGKKLVIEVDLGQELGPSNSGKTIIVGSTQGNASIAQGNTTYGFGVNVWKKPKGA